MFDLSLEMLRVVEEAAIASARTMGMGDPNISDQAAVEAMRRCLDTLAIEGTIVIGEGERDEAPMLYIGETVGSRSNGLRSRWISRSIRWRARISVPPGAPGSITVLAASRTGRAAERARLLHGKDHRRSAGEGSGGPRCAR